MRRIAVDGMGGDFAPQEIVAGAIEAALKLKDEEIILVGNPKKIKGLIAFGDFPSNLKIHPASEIISMEAHPFSAVRLKRNSSLVKGIRLIKQGEADAFVSAGNTGAVVIASILHLGRITNIDRPGIAALLPFSEKGVVLIDVGATVDCNQLNLWQFALMGTIFTRKILAYSSPRIGILNIGKEKEKGNKLTKSTFKLLEPTTLNFQGNCEPEDLISGKFEVVIADGFTGNICLKAMEDIYKLVIGEIKKTCNSSFKAKTGGLLLKSFFREIKEKYDPDQFGGMPLLGVNAPVIIAHGRSKKEAIKNAILQAEKMLEVDVASLIEKGLRS